MAGSAPAVDCARSYFGSNFVGASWTKLVGTQTSDEVYWNVDGNDLNNVIDSVLEPAQANNGTEWNIQVGNPSITPPDPGYTGIAFYADTTRQAVIRMASGKTGAATIPAGGQGITTPVVAASGLSTSFALQSTVPYVGLCPPAEVTLKSISIPINVVWYVGVTATSPKSNLCQYWLNYCYGVSPGPAGCYPLAPLASASSVTTAPVALC